VTLAWDVDFSYLWYSGAGISTSGGLAYPVSLGGVPYNLDLSEGNEFSHSSVPLMRATQDDKENVGGQTLNPESDWRRTFESWHVGAGQSHFDRPDESHPYRFRRSQGINVWDRNQISLLNSTDEKRSSVSTNLRLAVAGDYLYATDGATIIRTQDVTVGAPTWTTITGVPVNAPTSIASDGYNVLTAHGASGIYKTTRGAATTASNITGTVDNVAYGKGRWIATNDNVIYDITTLVVGGGALPSAHFTHPNTDFTWNSFAEGPTAFYIGGYSGDKSLIYRLVIREDGTGLEQPVVAGFLPDGELVQSMQGYLGFVLIGTSLGVRIGIVGGQGDLTIGALIPTDDPVLAFEGQDKYVWFGWGSYEAADTAGLGRIDLETFSNSESLAPAFASDLMATGVLDGNTTSVVTFQNLRVFSVNGTAGSIWAEDPGSLVATGQIDTGLFDYGLTDEKLSLYVDISHVSADGGDLTVAISLDRAAFVNLATITGVHRPIATGEARANEFELRMILTRDASDPTVGPVIRRWNLRAQPATPTTEQIIVPLLIGPVVQRLDGMSDVVDPIAQAAHVEELCETKQVAIYQEANRAWSVIVSDYQMFIRHMGAGHDAELGYNATMNVRLKVIT
jgi:hypothetical protein